MRSLGSMNAVDNVVTSWAETWNAHDMMACAQLVAPDVDFVTVRGLRLRGRDEFLRHHVAIHQRHLRDSLWATRGYSSRRLRDDVVVVHHEWTISGEYDEAGAPRAPRSGIFTWVLLETDGAWRIAAAHNTNCRE